MKALGLQTVALAGIEVGERLRAIDEGHARLPAENIRQTGRLRQPIEVRTQKGRKGQKPYRLIAGGHRWWAAHQILGWTEIEAFVFEADDEARLAEIDENLMRHDLNPLDRGVFLAERETVYLRLHPETGHGGDRGNQHTGGKARQTGIVSFCQDTAERCGWTARTIQRALKVGSLPLEIRARVAGTWLSRHQNELLDLADTPADRRMAVVNLLLAEDAQVKTVKAAEKLLAGTAAAVSDDRAKKIGALNKAWARAMRPGRKAWLAQLEPGEMAELVALLDELGHLAIPALADVEEA